MPVMPIVRSLRRNLFLVLLLVSTLMLSGQVLGQKYVTERALSSFPGYGVVEDSAGRIICGSSDGWVHIFDATFTETSSFNAFGVSLHGIDVDELDNIYVVDRDSHVLRIFDKTGVLTKTIGGYGSADGLFIHPRTVTVDSVHKFMYISDDGTSRIQKFSLDGTHILTFGGVGNASHQFSLATGGALDRDGNLWVVDRFNAKVKKFDSSGNFLTEFGSHGTGDGQFDYPSFVHTDASGFLYVQEGNGSLAPHSYRVQKFTSSGQFICSFTDTTRVDFMSHEFAVLRNGKLISSDSYNARMVMFAPEWPKYRFARQFGGFGTTPGSLNGPWGIAINSVGHVFVSEYGNQRIQWFSQNGNSLGTFDNSNGPGGVLDSLTMGFGPTGELYVADRFNHRIVNFTFSSNTLSVNRVIGSYGSGDRQFNMPHGLSVDSHGNVYVADLFNSRVVAFDPLGNQLWTSGTYGSGLGQLDFLHDTAVTNDGHVLVADTSNHRITVLGSNGTPTTTFGGYGQLPGQMNNPKGIGIAQNGLIAVPEEAGQRVQLFLPDYSFLQVVGGSGAGNGLFHNPIDVSFDNANGLMFVVDHVNHLVQVFEPYYDFDSIAPVSTIYGLSSNLWAASNVSITITASDYSGGSGVKAIHYAINQGTEIIVTGSSASFTLTENGTHSIAYWAVDDVGNSEATNYATVKIDKVAPVTTLTRSGGQITLSAIDTHSGVSKTKVQVNGGAVVDYTGSFADTVHTVTYWSEDVAGNVEAAKTEIINPGVQSISASQVRLPGGFGVVGTVTLDKAAPVGGTLINLASSIPGVVVVDTTVTVPEGATTATFDIDANPVANDTVVSVTASKYETSQSLLLTIQAPTPTSLSYLSTTLSGGTSTTASITISGPAPVGGTVVSLASSSLSALVPTSVTIPAGQMTTTFTVSTNLVANDTSAVISATVYGVKVKSTLSILGPKVTSVTVASASIASTATTTGTVTLSTNAPVGGKVVTLSSSNTGVASVPVSVTVPAGSNTANFTISAGTVAANTSVTITAATNGSTGTATLTVTPPAAALFTLTTNVTAATGGVALTGTVTLTRAAPTGGAVVTLASSSTTIGTVPASVTVPAGATTATFTITTRTVTAASALTITGTYLGVSKSAVVTVNPVRLASTLALNPSSVKGGVNSTGTVTLTGPATEDVVVTLTSGTTTVSTVPVSVTVPAGATSVTFTITTRTQTSTRTSVITARTGTTSRTATLTVTR